MVVGIIVNDWIKKLSRGSKFHSLETLYLLYFIPLYQLASKVYSLVVNTNESPALIHSLWYTRVLTICEPFSTQCESCVSKIIREHVNAGALTCSAHF